MVQVIYILSYHFLFERKSWKLSSDVWHHTESNLSRTGVLRSKGAQNSV